MICITCKKQFARIKYSRAIYCSIACRPNKQYSQDYKDKQKVIYRSQGYHEVMEDDILRQITWLTNCKLCNKEITENRRLYCSHKCQRTYLQRKYRQRL